MGFRKTWIFGAALCVALSAPPTHRPARSASSRLEISLPPVPPLLQRTPMCRGPSLTMTVPGY